MEANELYRELTRRNRVLIGPDLQERLRRQRFVVAGVGSTGGACVMPLVRTGAERLLLADPGVYEVSNLNRQEARLADVGRNKARVQADRALEVNPFAEIDVDERGIDASDAGRLLRDGDLVIDAIDVTESSGLAAKLALHEACCRLGLTVITAYDIAFTQYVELFDYRRVRRPLRGRVGSRDAEPLRLMRALVPPRALPDEIFAVLDDRRRNPGEGWPQLAMTSMRVGPIVVAYVLRLLAARRVRRAARLDLLDTVRPASRRLANRCRRDLDLVAALWHHRGS
jgi:molybdopterin/thiamine biosynthesis adenylyltransferase